MSWGGVRLLFRRSSSLLSRHLGDLLICPRGADAQAARLALRSVALARRRAARCDLRCSFARWPVFFAVHFLLVVEALVRVPGFSWAGDRGHFWRRFALLLTFVLFVGPLCVLLVFMFSPFLGPWFFVCWCILFLVLLILPGFSGLVTLPVGFGAGVTCVSSVHSSPVLCGLLLASLPACFACSTGRGLRRLPSAHSSSLLRRSLRRSRRRRSPPPSPWLSWRCCPRGGPRLSAAFRCSGRA